MAYKPHYRMTMEGVFLGTSEIFSYHIALAQRVSDSPFATTLDPNNAVWADLAQDAANFHGSNGANLHQSAELRQVKFAPIGADGKYTGPAVVVGKVRGGVSDGARKYPNQVALTVSLDALSGDGLVVRRGRFYLPAPQQALQGDGRINEADAQMVTDAADAFLEAVNNQPGIDVLGLAAVIASQKGSGSNDQVDRVRVGRVFDTVRRRRNKLQEVHRSALVSD